MHFITTTEVRARPMMWWCDRGPAISAWGWKTETFGHRRPQGGWDPVSEVPILTRHFGRHRNL